MTLTPAALPPSFKKALVQVVSDLIMDTAKLSKATSKVLAILDDYYLTPIYDTDGDGIPRPEPP